MAEVKLEKRICTHPPGCTKCNWCGYDLFQEAKELAETLRRVIPMEITSDWAKLEWADYHALKVMAETLLQKLEDIPPGSPKQKLEE